MVNPRNPRKKINSKNLRSSNVPDLNLDGIDDQKLESLDIPGSIRNDANTRVNNILPGNTGNTGYNNNNPTLNSNRGYNPGYNRAGVPDNRASNIDYNASQFDTADIDESFILGGLDQEPSSAIQSRIPTSKPKTNRNIPNIGGSSYKDGGKDTGLSFFEGPETKKGTGLSFFEGPETKKGTGLSFFEGPETKKDTGLSFFEGPKTKKGTGLSFFEGPETKKGTGLSFFEESEVVSSVDQTVDYGQRKDLMNKAVSNQEIYGNEAMGNSNVRSDKDVREKNIVINEEPHKSNRTIKKRRSRISKIKSRKTGRIPKEKINGKKEKTSKPTKKLKRENLVLPVHIEFPHITITQAQINKAKEDPRNRIGNYVLIKKLGEGGMGKVFLAVHKELNTMYVIKSILRKTNTEHARQRFLKEAQITAGITNQISSNISKESLTDPEIVQVVNFGSEPKIGDYLVMNFIDGVSLGDIGELINKEQKLLSDITAINWLLDSAKALRSLHDKKNNIMHRDIKPDNIMLTKEGKIVICDLGLAKKVPQDWEADEEYQEAAIKEIQIDNQNVSLTQGGVVGTIAYASPEQIDAKERKNMDTRSDIYSLGATFYELLTGNKPYEDKNPMRLMYKVANMKERPVKLSELNPDIHPELEKIIERMMKKKIKRRYQQIEEVIRDLEELKLKLTTGVLGYYYKKHPKLLLSVIGGILLSVSIGVVAILTGKGKGIEDNIQKKTSKYKEEGDRLYRKGMSIPLYPLKDLKGSDINNRISYLKKAAVIFAKAKKINPLLEERYKKICVELKLTEAVIPILGSEKGDTKNAYMLRKIDIMVNVLRKLEQKYFDQFRDNKLAKFYLCYGLYIRSQSEYAKSDRTERYANAVLDIYKDLEPGINKLPVGVQIQLNMFAADTYHKLYEKDFDKRARNLDKALHIEGKAVSVYEKIIKMIENLKGNTNYIKHFDIASIYFKASRSIDNLIYMMKRRNFNQEMTNQYIAKSKNYILKSVLYEAYENRRTGKETKKESTDLLYSLYKYDTEKLYLILKAILRINPKDRYVRSLISTHNIRINNETEKINKLIEDFNRESPLYN